MHEQIVYVPKGSEIPLKMTASFASDAALERLAVRFHLPDALLQGTCQVKKPGTLSDTRLYVAIVRRQVSG